jgi:hypothetical protein
MNLIYITADPDRAIIADRAGVDRVMVDLEIIGKEQRQAKRNTVISRHTFDDVSRVRSVLRKSRLMVRVNPIHAQTQAEVAACLDRGAEILMLPMFTTVREVEQFVRVVDGRADCTLLLETAPALARAPEILSVEGISDVLIGLNDLHIAMKLDFMFELIAWGIVPYLAAQCRERKMMFGVGGVGRIGSGPLDARLICAEHVAMGSQMVILSRDFNKSFELTTADERANTFIDEIQKLRAHFTQLHALPEAERKGMSEKFKMEVRRLSDNSRLVVDGLVGQVAPRL